MDYTFLRPKRVWAALAGHPDRPSLRTVTRWCEGYPVPAWVDAVIREQLGAGPEQTAAPAWWAEAEARILLEIQSNRAMVRDLMESERRVDRDLWQRWQAGMDEALTKIAGRSPSPPGADRSPRGSTGHAAARDRPREQPRRR